MHTLKLDVRVKGFSITTTGLEALKTMEILSERYGAKSDHDDKSGVPQKFDEAEKVLKKRLEINRRLYGAGLIHLYLSVSSFQVSPCITFPHYPTSFLSRTHSQIFQDKILGRLMFYLDSLFVALSFSNLLRLEKQSQQTFFANLCYVAFRYCNTYVVCNFTKYLAIRTLFL